jgi:ribosomal protein S12 methylthiotransferase
VLREAEQLVRAGVKELLVISQDTSAYGVDLKYARSLAQRGAPRRFYDLAKAWANSGVWIRCTMSIPTRTSIR